jgi:hypothetical protein
MLRGQGIKGSDERLTLIEGAGIQDASLITANIIAVRINAYCLF